MDCFRAARAADVRTSLFVVLALGLATASSAAPAPAPAVPPAVLRQVRAALPRGWSADVRGDVLTVRRDREVEWTLWLPNAAPGSTPTTRKAPYTLTFRFGPRLDEVAYERQRTARERLERELAAMHERMDRIPHKFDSYLPRTPAEKDLVKDYEATAARLRRMALPDFFSDEHSLYVVRDRFYFAGPSSPVVEAECALARARVTALFSAYGLPSATRKLVKALKARRDSFELTVLPLRGGARKGLPASLTLSAVPGARPRVKGEVVVPLSEAEVLSLIDLLAAFGWLPDRPAPAEAGVPKGAWVRLRSSGGKSPVQVRDLGWDAQTLQKFSQVRAALRDKAARATDDLMVTLRDYQGQWEKETRRKKRKKAP